MSASDAGNAKMAFAVPVFGGATTSMDAVAPRSEVAAVLSTATPPGVDEMGGSGHRRCHPDAGSPFALSPHTASLVAHAAATARQRLLRAIQDDWHAAAVACAAATPSVGGSGGDGERGVVVGAPAATAAVLAQLLSRLSSPPLPPSSSLPAALTDDTAAGTPPASAPASPWLHASALPLAHDTPPPQRLLLVGSPLLTGTRPRVAAARVTATDSEAVQDAVWWALTRLGPPLLLSSGERLACIRTALAGGPGVVELDVEWPRGDASRVVAAAPTPGRPAPLLTATQLASPAAVAAAADAQAESHPHQPQLVGHTEALLVAAQLHARSRGWRCALRGAWPARARLVLEVPAFPRGPGALSFCDSTLPQLMAAAGFGGWALPDGLLVTGSVVGGGSCPGGGGAARSGARGAGGPASTLCHLPFVLERCAAPDREAALALDPVGPSELAGTVRAWPAGVASWEEVVEGGGSGGRA